MLQELIKQVVENYNADAPETPLFHFSYGKDHWQNLVDHAKDDNLPFEERNKYFKLLFVDEDDVMNSFSAVDGTTYTGELLILASSMVSDPSYDYKYETHIKHLKELANEFRGKLTDCNNWSVRKWQKIEVENIYDNNLDGIKVNFIMYKGDE